MSLVPSGAGPIAPTSSELVPDSSYEADGGEWWVVTLTEALNNLLRTRCYSADQIRVWSFPHHSFTVRARVVRAEQIATGRPSYINAILIASRGLVEDVECTSCTTWVFKDTVRLPGWWGGSCAACKWKDRAAYCSYAKKGEVKWEPPESVVEELGDVEMIEEE